MCPSVRRVPGQRHGDPGHAQIAQLPRDAVPVLQAPVPHDRHHQGRIVSSSGAAIPSAIARSQACIASTKRRNLTSANPPRWAAFRTAAAALPAAGGRGRTGDRIGVIPAGRCRSVTPSRSAAGTAAHPISLTRPTNRRSTFRASIGTRASARTGRWEGRAAGRIPTPAATRRGSGIRRRRAAPRPTCPGSAGHGAGTSRNPAPCPDEGRGGRRWCEAASDGAPGSRGFPRGGPPADGLVRPASDPPVAARARRRQVPPIGPGRRIAPAGSGGRARHQAARHQQDTAGNEAGQESDGTQSLALRNHGEHFQFEDGVVAAAVKQGAPSARRCVALGAVTK